MTCQHCGDRKSARGKRGLCLACYTTPAVRAMYPPRQFGYFDHEPTEAELDQLIAEQRKCLPAWWADECEKR